MRFISSALRSLTLFAILLLGVSWGIAGEPGDPDNYQWISPEEHVIQGRISHAVVEGYNRLPGHLQNQLRKPVWDLSTNSAGLYIDFKTTATKIQIRYQVTQRLSMPHMPATGVSGVDLYAYNANDDVWEWASGRYLFKDTITYTYEQLATATPGRTYRLYLPLYNTVSDLEIGIPNSDSLEFYCADQAPVIVYGTSIAQGACASRPGLAWTNILNRKLNQEVVNLGFSGNGRLEEPILKWIAHTPAKYIILDCLPNLGITKYRSEAQVDSLLYNAVLLIRKQQATTPIILTENSSGFDSHILNHSQMRGYERTTNVARKVFSRLKTEGVSDIYLLDNRSLGLDINSTVDYVHPNDLGMMYIAEAYYQLLRSIDSNP